MTVLQSYYMSIFIGGNMAFMDWNDKQFGIHVEEIDNQHKRLFTILNNLHNSLLTGSAQHSVGPIVVELVEYCREHFADEEALMQKIHFPGYQAHKVLHDKFFAKLMDIIVGLKNGKKVSPFEIMSLIKNWLIEHIAVEDKKIGDVLQELLVTAEASEKE